MIAEDDDFYKKIFWTDEFTVQAYPNGEIVFFRAPYNSDYHVKLVSPKVQNGGVRVMFWGSMTYYAYGPLIPLEGSQNQHTYIQLLKDLVLPEFEASTHLRQELKSFWPRNSLSSSIGPLRVPICLQLSNCGTS